MWETTVSTPSIGGITVKSESENSSLWELGKDAPSAKVLKRPGLVQEERSPDRAGPMVVWTLRIVKTNKTSFFVEKMHDVVYIYSNICEALRIKDKIT